MRAFDAAAAAILLILASPILLLAAIAIKIESPGPVFFRQTRLGKDKKPFTAYKLRSMRPGADEAVHKEYIGRLVKDAALARSRSGVYKLAGDARVTRVGGVLRRTSVDELPQLWNVLKGEMNLVGPRPVIPYELEHYEDWMMERFAVRPGITGWWQVNGRNAADYRQMVEKDIYYVKNRGWKLDALILLKTARAVCETRKTC